MLSKPSPAMTGMASTRLAMSQYQLGCASATTLNTTMLTTITTSRNPVPQRGCSRLARRTDETSSGHPASNARTGVHVGRPHQRAHAQVQLLADERDAAHERELPEPARIDLRLQLTAVDDYLFGRGHAHGDRVVALAAHHHALDDRLTPVEER